MSINDVPVNDFLLKSETKNEVKDPAILTDVVKATKLAELDLNEELLVQYKTARSLLELVKSDTETPLNQKAQVMNTITTLLTHILKLQEQLHNLEKMKLIESTLIETLKEFPKVKERFLKEYEKALKVANK